MKRIVCVSLALFILVAVLSGCAEKVPDQYKDNIKLTREIIDDINDHGNIDQNLLNMTMAMKALSRGYIFKDPDNPYKDVEYIGREQVDDYSYAYYYNIYCGVESDIRPKERRFANVYLAKTDETKDKGYSIEEIFMCLDK